MSKAGKGTPKTVESQNGSSSSGGVKRKRGLVPGVIYGDIYPSGASTGRSAVVATGSVVPALDTVILAGEQIIHRVEKWAGGRQQAENWFFSEPLPSFGDRTAESLVKSGKAEAVRDYLDSVALGAYE